MRIGDFVVVMPQEGYSEYEGLSGEVVAIDGADYTVRFGVAQYGEEIIVKGHELWPDPKRIWEGQIHDKELIPGV